MKYCATVSEAGVLRHKEFEATTADKAIDFAESHWDTISVYIWKDDDLKTIKWNG